MFSATPAASSTLTTDTISFFVGGNSPSSSRTQCSLDSAAFANCSSPTALMLDSGPHTFQVRLVSETGGVLAASLIYSWTVVDSLPTPGVETALTWIPCAQGGAVCSFGEATGAVRVRYGVTPFESEPNNTKTFTGRSSVTCNDATLGKIPDSPTSPSWMRKDCWYEGKAPVIVSAVTITGPAIEQPLVVPAFPGTDKAQIRAFTGSQGPVPSDVGAFREACGFSHFAFDDPLVFPNQPGASHLHLFFGNTAITGNSTYQSVMTSGNSTCAGGVLNRSAYWVPAIVDTVTHRPVTSIENNVYYKTGYNGIAPSDVKPLPRGLAMITGSSKNTTESGNTTTRYECHVLGSGEGGAWTPYIPTNCRAGEGALPACSPAA